MQASVYGGQRILPELPGAIHLESGIIGERRLSAGDDRAARSDDFTLGFLIFRVFVQIKSKPQFAARICETRFLPIIKCRIKNAEMPQTPTRKVIGSVVPSLKWLTSAAEIAAKPYCIVPIKAEAAPAVADCPASAPAVVFG